MTEAMKFRIRNKLYGASIFSSPWLSAAAVALLALIIATFALHNYGLERQLMREALEQRAATLVRALRSGIRVALVGELHRHLVVHGQQQVLPGLQLALQLLAVRVRERRHSCRQGKSQGSQDRPEL